MSPEQAQGQLADARSDIFSFGLVLYEMLSGRRAFSGESPLATAASLIKEEPPLLEASSPLKEIVEKCLMKLPSERYQTISEVKTILEKISKVKMGKGPAELQPSIAVLPFVNMSGDKEQEYFSDGLAEEIINALTQIPGLKVIARTSAFAFRSKEQDVRGIAEALGATNILEGSVRKAGNRIRVTAQLITATDGSHLWSQRYDREITDVFAIQDEISQAIAEKLRVRLSSEGRQQARRHTEDMVAYNLYLKGRYHFYKFTADSSAKSKEYYEQALAEDPGYALAWVRLAHLYNLLGFPGLMRPKEANPQSNRAALRALELDPFNLPAHIHPGQIHIAMEKFDEAIQILESARQVLGYSPTVLDLLGFAYARAGRTQEAQKLLEYLKGIARKTYVPSESFARIIFGLGDIDIGFNWLEKAVEERDALIFSLNVSPMYDLLRSYPRYHALLRKMNLEA